MAQDNSNSTMEMGTSDQVLVTATKKSTLTYIVGFIAMLVAVAVVVTLVVVLSGNEGGVAEPIISTTEGPTTSFTTTTTTTTTTTAIPPIITEPSTESPPTTPSPDIGALELDEIINGVFSPEYFNATWSSGNEVLFRNENGDLVSYNIDTDTPTRLVLNTSQILQQSSRVMQVSPDNLFVVLAYSVIPVYRYSFLARYALVEVSSGNESDVMPLGVTEGEAYLQNFVWGPSGHSFAYVYLNNIYYQESLADTPQQITTSGQLNVIYNGIPDWVYEEEVFSTNNALWFSNDGTKLAYVTFDDSAVRIMRVPHYGVPGSVAYQYTQHHEIRYPKPGTTNPTVSVTLRDLATGASNTYIAPTTLDEPILSSVKFATNDSIAVLWTNRVQTSLVVLMCVQGQATCQQIYSYTESEGWIDTIPLIFNSLGTSFITILPQVVNGVMYKQIVQVSDIAANMWTNEGRTNTPHTVSDILTWTDDDVIWYKATHVNDSAEQHVYSVNPAGEVSCFTCDIRREDNGECLYNDATMNNDGTRITVNCAGPNVPQVFLYNTNGSQIRVWNDNAEIANLLENKKVPSIIRLSVPIVDGFPDADVHIQVPDDYDTRADPIPLLVYVYGGPDTALVTKAWGIDWGSSLVSRWGVAVAHIDGRGSGLRGVANMFAVNRRLGTVEIEDQISVTRYLQRNFRWIDNNRTCIWGWSYGGYAASLALARGEEVFRCAAAVAPVVDWRFYDTIYTERYMDLPTTNAAGYEQSSLLTDQVVEAYRNKSYLLIHGTADDNVHYQHAMLLSRRLQTNDVYFTQMSYTDEDHGMVAVRPHLYHVIEKFLEENML